MSNEFPLFRAVLALAVLISPITGSSNAETGDILKSFRSETAAEFYASWEIKKTLALLSPKSLRELRKGLEEDHLHDESPETRKQRGWVLAEIDKMLR